MLNVERLRKVWRLAVASPQPREAQAALARARAIVEMEGYALPDIPRLLGQKSLWHVDAPLLADRIAVLWRYGSLEAATQPTPIERAVDEAVKRFRGGGKAAAQGRHADYPGRNACDRVPKDGDDAVRAAWPLPSTMSEAKGELDLWQEREQDLRAVWLDPWDITRPSPACGLRWDIVRDLLRTGLRAQTLADVLVRQRWLIDSDMFDMETDDAVLADLEHLCELQAAVQTGQAAQPASHTAGQRRNQVLALLSNMDTAALSDREIARRVRCSPQTVSNHRRRMFLSGCGKPGSTAGT